MKPHLIFSQISKHNVLISSGACRYHLHLCATIFNANNGKICLRLKSIIFWSNQKISKPIKRFDIDMITFDNRQEISYLLTSLNYTHTLLNQTQYISNTYPLGGKSVYKTARPLPHEDTHSIQVLQSKLTTNGPRL